MSIAEMIMQGGNQQSKSWSVLSENLGRLGQQVGQQLAMREYQKQAAEALPAMQAAYKSAMDDVAAGEVTQGYKKFMDAQFQFGASQNPFISQANEAAGTIFQNATTMYEKQKQRQAQYGGGSGGVGGGPRMPQGPAAFFKQSPPTTETNYSGEGEGMGGAGDVDRQPQNQPVALWADQIDAEATNGLLVMQGATAQQQNPFEENWSFTMAGYKRPTKEFEEKVMEDNKEFINSPPEKQQEFKDSVSSTVNPRGTEFIEAPGLSNFKGFEDISGIFIPIETYIQFPESLSLQEDEKGSKYTTKFVQKTVNQQQMDKANALAYTDLPTAIRRINDNQTLQRFFTENTPDQLDVGETTKEMEGGKQFVGYIGVRGTDNYIDLSKDDLAAARIITGLPSTSKTLLSPLAKAERPIAPKATTKPQQPSAAEPAAPEIPEEAAGLQQIVTQGQAAKEVEQAKATENRIKAIDAEIKRLSSPVVQSGGQMAPSGFMMQTGGGMSAAPLYSIPKTERQKSPEEAQADIKKITKLKAEKELIVAKSEGRVFNTVEEAKASKKKFPSGTTIYIGGKPAKVK
jgi:hypothetical protein